MKYKKYMFKYGNIYSHVGKVSHGPKHSCLDVRYLHSLQATVKRQF